MQNKWKYIKNNIFLAFYYLNLFLGFI
jgi:hypothetical protein